MRNSNLYLFSKCYYSTLGDLVANNTYSTVASETTNVNKKAKDPLLRTEKTFIGDCVASQTAKDCFTLNSLKMKLMLHSPLKFHFT